VVDGVRGEILQQILIDWWHDLDVDALAEVRVIEVEFVALNLWAGVTWRIPGELDGVG
jgi:hypothetical protein